MNKEDISEDLYHIKNNLTNTQWMRNKARQRFSAKISKVLYREKQTSFFDEKWDNLIILDACRADLFESNVDLEVFDDYTTKYSNASLTSEWVKKNLQDNEFRDMIYLTSNPFVSMYAKNNFHELVELWERYFDEDYHTVLPETVTKKALEVYQDDKKLVAHFMQPHWPFYVHNLGRSPKSSMDILGKTETKEAEPHNPFKGLRQGHYSKAEVWEAYRETFEAAYKHALELAQTLDGRTVITSDHGNLFGEKLHPYIPIHLYGHPTRGLRHPKLVEVPWAVVDGTRRTTTEESTVSPDDVDQRIVEDRLEHLGYK
jgi:hypothetical protein